MKIILISLLQGLGVLVIVFAVFGIALELGLGELDSRALAFTTLVVANIGLIFTNRSWIKTIVQTAARPNRALWWVVLGSLSVLALVLYIPFFRNLFHFSTLHFLDLIVCLTAGIVSILWFEALKILKLHLR